MNYLWAFMILTGVVFAAFHGTLPAVTQAALDSAKEAVTLCITMMGVMSFWVGLMKIAEKTGIIAGLSRRLAPVLHFLFPDIPKDHPANKYIATNMIANIFGQPAQQGYAKIISQQSFPYFYTLSMPFQTVFISRKSLSTRL